MEREGRRGFFPCNGGCASIITSVRVVGAFDHFTDHRFTRTPFSKIPEGKTSIRRMGHAEMCG